MATLANAPCATTPPGERDLIAPLWTVQDVANYLRVPVQTLYSWRSQAWVLPHAASESTSATDPRTSSAGSTAWTRVPRNATTTAPARHPREDQDVA
jgi:hypothetical protein